MNHVTSSNTLCISQHKAERSSIIALSLTTVKMEDHIKQAFTSKILNIKDFFEQFSISTAEDGKKSLKKHLQKLMFMSKPKGISE